MLGHRSPPPEGGLIENLKGNRGQHHRDFFFIQMADIQFGIFASLSGADEAKIEEYRRARLIVRPAPKITGFAQETELYTKAIAGANRLRPDFVVMCGDMVQNTEDPAQFAELMRITGQLSNDIPMNWVPGNHDVGNDLTPESLALYRERHGDGNYFFDHLGSRFIVLDSNVPFFPPKIPGEWERQLEFLKSALQEAREIGSTHILVFTHYPLFLEDPDEQDSSLVVPKEKRRILLDLFHAYDVSAVFSGHWHRNNYARDGKLLMVTSSAVGYTLGYDPSGFRVVKVLQDRIEHEYFGLDDLPEAVGMGR